jgi:hypothetical protein
VTIYYTDPRGQEQQIHSQAIDITVNSVKPSEAEDIKDIKPPVEVAGKMNPYFWGTGGLLLLICGAILLYLRRRRRARGEHEEEELGPPRPAHEIAYEELERIEALHLVDQGLIKEYYTELSEVIRRYVGHRYRIITMELTTAELVDSMEDQEIEGMHVEAVRFFLEACDLVKFAKFIPSKDEMVAALPRAREIVDATRETILAPVEGIRDETAPEDVEPVETAPAGTDAELK